MSKKDQTKLGAADTESVVEVSVNNPRDSIPQIYVSGLKEYKNVRTVRVIEEPSMSHDESELSIGWSTETMPDAVSIQQLENNPSLDDVDIKGAIWFKYWGR